jgi:predicted lipoprotein with Yx(FWY)xxD motif
MPSCLALWPPFYAEHLTVPKGLKASDFGVFTLKNGQKQTTYRGWQLYLYAGDTKKGDTNGEGLFGIWYVVHPEKLQRYGTGY